MNRSRVSYRLGKHKLYQCQCGYIRGVSIPPSAFMLRPCSGCGADITIQPFTIEDINIRRRDIQGKQDNTGNH